MPKTLLTILALGAASLVSPVLADQAPHDWSGAYVGLSLGANTLGSSLDVPDPAEQFTHNKHKHLDFSDTDVAPRLNAGYNFQAGNVVFGVEGDTSVPVGNSNTW